eukprot:3593135-Amphidinium_carterae.1
MVECDLNKCHVSRPDAHHTVSSMVNTSEECSPPTISSMRSHARGVQADAQMEKRQNRPQDKNSICNYDRPQHPKGVLEVEILNA